MWHSLRDLDQKKPSPPSFSPTPAPNLAYNAPLGPPGREKEVPTVSFPPVKKNSGQLPGETIQAFLERRRIRNEKLAKQESPQKKQSRLAQESNALRGSAPGRGAKARVFIWDDENGFFIRRAYSRENAASRWDEFTPAQRIFDGFSSTWDLCTALAPDEEAEPEDDDDDALMAVTGSDAAQDLTVAHALNADELAEDQGQLQGWAVQKIEEILPSRFGFNSIQTPEGLDPKKALQTITCSWAVGNKLWKNDKYPLLPFFLQSIFEQKPLSQIPPSMMDMANPDSDLTASSWAVDVFIWRETKPLVYEIRSSKDQDSLPSILLEHAATVLQILRMHEENIFTIIRELVTYGVEFHVAWKKSPQYRSYPPPRTPGLGRRSEAYKGTIVDFWVYVKQRNDFLHSPRGHVALFYGGIIGRVARLVLEDPEDLACLAPSDELLRTGARFYDDEALALWRPVLTLDEVNLICGVYEVETGMH
ncbi:hypothetical protein FB45DRAFT_767826 [Roridomyces roridus]|uniref:Uncharacterized protein n=1 Tax=Roridomyces roridus TaxID=1738132 RepID=A0AAD7AZ23_9AGAR|nr:hypothetical protein FB45DRAFT_767826 [Roridomyces roridus]